MNRILKGWNTYFFSALGTDYWYCD